jgi:hypothetical protein
MTLNWTEYARHKIRTVPSERGQEGRPAGWYAEVYRGDAFPLVDGQPPADWGLLKDCGFLFVTPGKLGTEEEALDKAMQMIDNRDLARTLKDLTK